MKKIKKGDIVGRLSYGKDIFFIIDKIIKLPTHTLNSKKIALLKGLTMRITADCPLEDLELIDKRIVHQNITIAENRFLAHLSNYNLRTKKSYNSGKVLHLDGDLRYSQKSIKYYRELGINAIVRNIAESKQPFLIQNLLNRFTPDILVITGHDAMIKNGTGFNNLNNYRNSAYFVNTIQKARAWENGNHLAIFAGACQSYYEALIEAGANFASSPARILIDFVDPLIVAEHIAITNRNKFVSIRDFENELRDGQKGISGVGCYGKC